jgi:signal transduction histidine kinase
LGRTALIALGMSAVVAVVLAVAIPKHVEQHLINGEIRSLTRIAGELADQGMIPPRADDPEAMAALDEAVRGSLIGSDIVRVKIWLSDGTIAYSDEPGLIGKSFPLSDSVKEVFNGRPHVEFVDVSNPENVYERGLPPLREFYIPASGDDGSVVIFGAYHLAEPIETTVGNIRQYVWLSIAIGIGLLAIFIAILIIVNGRAITHRRRLAEELFGDLVRSQADERTRIIGALHDDIGQSLYRVHYGLEDLRSRVAADSPFAEELNHLGMLVGSVDGSLRAELRLLRHGTGEEIALGPALDELAEVTEMESDLSVAVKVDTDCDLSPTARVALFHAAREAVTNTRKHAVASSVEIRVYRKGKEIRLDVTDDGVGIIEDEGLGLTTTRERLEAIGGGLRVRAARTGGTLFAAWMPAGECTVEG